MQQFYAAFHPMKMNSEFHQPSSKNIRQILCVICWCKYFLLTHNAVACFHGEQFQLNQDKMNFNSLRNIQGLHAPLKLQMEYRAARQVTLREPLCMLTPERFLSLYCISIVAFCFLLWFQIQRLPFLQSSNLALDTLRGSDESIGFEDILNGDVHAN